MKVFSNKIFFSNLETLKKRKGVKNSDIERSIGVSLGYLSRLKGEDKDSIPSVQIISRIAEYFGISIDMLLYTDLSDETNMGKIIKVLAKIEEDTKTRNVVWQCGENNYSVFQYLSSQVFTHPDENDWSIYQRTFTDESGEFAAFLGPYFIGEYSSGMRILLMNSQVLLSGKKGWEMYFLNEELNTLRNPEGEYLGTVKEWVATGIFHTFGKHGDTFAKSTEGLIHCIESSLNDYYIPLKSKNLIDRFLDS